MERFFILDKFNTWYDWRLYLTAKDTTDPEPKTNYVDLDGVSGTLDLSESLTGEPTYEDRKISASFWTDEGSFKDRENLLRKIVAASHGRKIKIIEPDDPAHYFYGRVKIDSKKNIIPYAEFTIEATCEPWRYAIDETTRIVDVSGQAVSAVINNHGSKTLCPLITVSGNVTVAGIVMSDGSYLIPDIKLYRGVNVIEVSGNGSVTFTYREADL